MELNILKLREFLDKHKGETILLFGFTFMIWQHFYKKLKALDIKLDLSNAVLIHGGGWKKLTELKISSEDGYEWGRTDTTSIIPCSPNEAALKSSVFLIITSLKLLACK